MKYLLLAFVFLMPFLLFAQEADARRGGRFFTSLVSRGAAGAAHSRTKTYTPDVLTVEQLVQCLKMAERLDDQSDAVEAKRSEVSNLSAQILRLETDIETQRSRMNRYSQYAIDSFNAEIERYNSFVRTAKTQNERFNEFVQVHNSKIESYNVSCAKKYYAEDLTKAQQLAGHQ